MLVLATLAIYSRATTCGFVNLDDVAYVTQSPEVQQGLTYKSIRWALVAEVAANWHPLTVLSHLLDVELYGLAPAGHHLTSILWHAANSGLLFWMLARTTGQLWPSFLVAALFAWHPLHVESVAWVSERKDVLSTFFWFSAIATYVRYVRQRHWGWYVATALLFCLGLLAKPMLVTLPCTLLLIDVWPLRRIRFASGRAGRNTGMGENQRCSESSDARRPEALGVSIDFTPTSKATFLPEADGIATWKQALWLVIEKVPMFGISAFFSVVTLRFQQSVGAVRALQEIPWITRLQNAAVTYVEYLRQAAWPTGLVIYYPHPGNTIPLFQSLGAGLLLLSVTVLVVWQLRRRPYLAVGWFWYLGTLVPVIGLIQVGDQARADRYTYVPLVGVFIMLAWGGADVLRQRARWKPWAAFAAMVWLGVLAGLTWQQIGVWHDSHSLFQHALAAGPRPDENWLAHYCLGEALQQEGALAEAEHHFEQASRANPRLGKPFFKIGEIRMAAGDLEGAARAFRAALRSNHPKRRLAAHNNLARCYLRLGRLDEAEAEYRRALQTWPASVDVRLGLIETLLRKREFAAAAAVAAGGLKYSPRDARLLDRLAWIRATASAEPERDGDQAVRLARQACELTSYQVPQMLNTLAAAYAERGDFENAIHWATRALRQIDQLLGDGIEAPSGTSPPLGADDERRKQLSQLSNLRQQIAEHIQSFQRRRPLRS